MLRFDGEVVVVTGAGGGVGKAYALELARRGAKVVINDLGGSPNGEGADAAPAERVAQEIRDAGGEAIANRNSVATQAGGKAIIDTALNTWGRIDAVIHNAGILRDGSFAKLDLADLEKVLDVHLRGAIYVGQPAFLAMKEAGRGGRLVFTTSSSALWGTFGQSAYAIAKMGVVGLVNVIALEGAKAGIKANAIAPTAATRLITGVDKGDDHPIAPGKMAATGVVLAHRDCPSSGEVFQSGGGWVTRVGTPISGGYLATGADAADELFAHWDQVREGGWQEPHNALDYGAMLETRLGQSDIWT